MSDTSFRHPEAIVETEQIGAGTRIWAFDHVLAGARIGCDCNNCCACTEQADRATASRLY